MADLVPWGLLLVGSDTEAFGSVDYEGDSCTWPLVAMQERPDAAYQGLVPDPTGDYMMQARVTAWLDSDHTQGTSASGTYGDGKDVSVQKLDGTNPKVLRQTSPSGSSDFTFTVAFLADEGRRLRLYVPATSGTSTASLFAYFCSTLRLALEPGLPIRLQTNTGSGWTDAATSALGECEAYLDSAGRFLDIDCLPETDPGWDPSYASFSDAPPCRIVVSLNGEDNLVIPATSLPSGQVEITASNRQWGALLGRGRFAASAEVTPPPVVHPVEFQGTPEPDFRGYVPAYYYAGGISITISPGSSANQALATLTLDATAGADATGYPMRSVFLTALTADFPAQQTAPLEEPEWTEYLPVYGRVMLTYDQGQSLKTASGEVAFIDTGGLLAPGLSGVVPAARAFQLYLGNLPDGVDPSPDNLTLVMTGYTGLRPGSGFRWRRQGAQTVVTISLDDRLVKARKACLYMPAADGTCHYWAMQQAAHRCGFTDDDLNFPLCSRFQTGEYQLSYGTALNPKFQPRPDSQLIDHMLQIRADSGDFDTSGQIQPMVMGVGVQGWLDYFPLPIGVVQAITNPGEDPAVYGVVPEQAFSAFPLFDGDGNPYLNEFLEFLETVAALDQIRSEAVFAGLDVESGGEVAGYALNPQLTTAPDAFGYIGAVRNAYVQISRRVSSVEVALRQAELAQVLLAFPSIRAFPVGHLQPGILILTPISVQDFATQGTDAPVGYYTTSVQHEWGQRADGRRYGLTHAAGPLLGQAGD